MNTFNDLGFITVIGYFFILNLVTFIVYGYDKNKAKRGEWRVSENTLLLLAVLGGSIGAIIGMKVFHHKTKNPTFSNGLPVILILQIILLIVFTGMTYFRVI